MPNVHRHWRAADVRALMDESRHWPRYELIDGELLVTPGPGNRHQLAIAELLSALRGYVDRLELGAVLLSPADLEFVAETIVQPDVFVVPRSPDPDRPLTEGWTPGQDSPTIVRDVLVWQPEGASEALRLDVAALVDEVWRKIRLVRA